MINSPRLFVAFALSSLAFTNVGWSQSPPDSAVRLLRTRCFGCHNNESAEAGVNLQQLVATDSFAAKFRTWQNISRQLEQKLMPPKDADQPTVAERTAMLSWVDRGIAAATKRHDGDPGHVVMRRLTSAEYAHAVHDITGVEIDFGRDFVSDAVGGAGFTNTGIVQFTQDSTLERYLEAARRIADHAVIGARPLTFFRDPGRTGFELAAMDRIQSIYRTHGFRRAAGEGGEAFGLDKYPKAFLIAWKYRHRRALGTPNATLKSLTEQSGVDDRFARHIHGIVTRKDSSFPLSVIVDAWNRLPVPPGPSVTAKAESDCQAISKLLMNWQNRFGANPDAKEEAPVLRADTFHVTRTQPFIMNVNWPEGTKTAHLVMTVEPADKQGRPAAVIKWKNARIQFRDYAKVMADPHPLRLSLTDRTVARLGFGRHPKGGSIDANGFVTVGTKPPAFEIPIPDGARSARVEIEAELDIEHGDDCIVRCTISQLEETDQGKQVSGLLANPDSPTYAQWKDDVLEFARQLPQTSQQEPAPSDRDPIPAPFDSTYNNAERNFFHTRIKYFRDDQFLYYNMLDDETRRLLDLAWADLLMSFEFHDTWLQFLARKYEFSLSAGGIGDMDAAAIAMLPEAARPHVRQLVSSWAGGVSKLQSAQVGHINDALHLASRAWRRPLTQPEQTELRTFYDSLRQKSELEHVEALRALIARIFVSPAFLYRAERTPVDGNKHVKQLSQWELASRLSFFLWSSVPDAELRRAAAINELQTTEQLQAQVQRMLRDSKSQRFSTEFFGQWFGFYRFNEYSGVDQRTFPEFSPSLRQSMYDEAIHFFDHIVRQDRPVEDILFANYSFANQELVGHYKLNTEPLGKNASAVDSMARISNANHMHRGGLLRLGAVLVTTSAPRRTSPVKRGDWILRRVLGTPVPPPPADAGSISADEVTPDGLSLRQRLEAHRRDSSCHNCHARFDALGFALENYDPLGRWRVTYRDRKPVETAGRMRDGSDVKGDDGLHDYLKRHQTEFHQTLARKLIGYSLGRQESVGDVSLVSRMTQRMENGGGLSGLIQEIVSSRQFRYHR